MEGRAEHVDAMRFEMRLGRDQRVEVGDFKRDMLDPFWSIGVARHFGLVGQFEEGDDIAPAAIEKDMHVGIIGASRRHMILGEGVGVAHAEHLAVPVDGRLGVLAAISGVVDPLEVEGVFHPRSVTTPRPKIQTEAGGPRSTRPSRA